MCLAIANPKGKEIPVEHLENGFNSNSDGAGFSIVENGKVKIFKGFFTFKHFLETYAFYSCMPSIVHFRFATHGACDAFNCHPWEVIPDKLSMIHNGIINVEATKEMSDTGHFCNFLLKPLLTQHPKLIYSKAFKTMLKMTIGFGNKLVFLDETNEITIINETAGEWLNEIWYSNTGYKTARYVGYNWIPSRYRNDAKDDFADVNARKYLEHDELTEEEWKAYNESNDVLDLETIDPELVQDAIDEEELDRLAKKDPSIRQAMRDEVKKYRARGMTRREAKRMVYGKEGNYA